jgi:hypothetical protein
MRSWVLLVVVALVSAFGCGPPRDATGRLVPRVVPCGYRIVRGADWAIAIPISWEEADRAPHEAFVARGFVGTLAVVTRDTRIRDSMELLARYRAAASKIDGFVEVAAASRDVAGISAILVETRSPSLASTSMVHEWSLLMCDRGRCHEVSCGGPESEQEVLLPICMSALGSLTVAS